MNNDEIEKELTKNIVNAFGNTSIPKDDEIVINSDNSESFEVESKLKGKHWKDLSDETVYDLRLNLPRLTAKAFCFYLPAYLIASLQSANGGEILEYVIFNLDPQEGESKKEAFIDRIKYFNHSQIEVIKYFVKYYKESMSYNSSDDNRLNNFWINYRV